MIKIFKEYKFSEILVDIEKSSFRKQERKVMRPLTFPQIAKELNLHRKKDILFQNLDDGDMIEDFEKGEGGDENAYLENNKSTSPLKLQKDELVYGENKNIMKEITKGQDLKR